MPTSAAAVPRPNSCAAPWWRRQRGSLIEVKLARSHALFFQHRQISDQVRDLARVEPELRHGRMVGNDALGESLFQVYEGIPGMEVRSGAAKASAARCALRGRNGRGATPG